jgi:hypothetical protein
VDNDSLSRLLREHIQRQEHDIDVAPVHARIRASARSPATQPAVRRGRLRILRRHWRACAVGLSAAAMVVLAFIIGTWVTPTYASAEALLREAQRGLSLPVDRCYLAEVRQDNAAPDDPLPARSVRIWTTGDRFRVEITRGQRKWAWGRDDAGAVWIAAGPQRGCRIAPDEIGPALQRSCDLYGLQPDTLLNEVLGNCQLQEEKTDRSGLVRTIHATPRGMAARGRLRGATIELDVESKAIRRLSWTRSGTGGTVTCTFTLVDTRPADERLYRLEGHLSEPFEVYDREFEPQKRKEMLEHWGGLTADRWVQPAVAGPDARTGK